MITFEGRTVVVTGGGGLLGRGMAVTFGQVGMNVVVADLNEETARDTSEAVTAIGARSIAVCADVTDRESMERLAAQAYAAFGAVHILCNNAGLAILRPFTQLTYEDWDRVLPVQLGGVINGVQAFLSRLLAQGGERHIVNTSSMSGVGRADLRVLNAPYVSAKFAVVGLSETMAAALAPDGIGVSVLCPGYVVPDPSSVTTFSMPSAAWFEGNLLSPTQVAEEVLNGERERCVHIFPHRAGRGELEDRHARLLDGFDQAARTSPPLTSAQPG